MASKISLLAFLLCIFVTLVECRMREIFSARCQARCFAKTLNSSQPCTGSCFTACIKPCVDHENFHKVKLCREYCREFKVKNDNWQCRHSCKYLLNLYNKGLKSGLCQDFNNTQSCGTTSCENDNVCPDLEKCCQQPAGCGKTCQIPSFNVTGYPSTPTTVNSTFIKRPRSVVIKWSYMHRDPRPQSEEKAVIFMVEVRHISIGSQQGVVSGEWSYFNMTKELHLTGYPRSNVWSEYHVLAVTEQGTSEYSTPSSAIYIPPEKPTPPRNFRVRMMAAVKGKVRLELVWSKPEKSEVPVHRYRVFWSKRLDSHTEELMSLRVHYMKINPDQHSALINGLRFNTTYLFEIQAICRYKGQRLRSSRVYLTARTMEQEEPDNKEAFHKKMGKVFSNSFKKPEIDKTTKTYPSGRTWTPPTTSSVVVGRPENVSRRPDAEANVRHTSSSNYIHPCLSLVLWLVLFHGLYW